MATKRTPAARILGTGHYLPAKVIRNEELPARLETSDEWIRTRTGITQRHIASPDEATSDMASAAANRAIEAAGIDPTEIDLILVATVTPDKHLPATATYVQQKIGARSDCPAMDIAAACAGFIYGLGVADAFVRAETARYVLVIGVELLSRVLDWDDRSTCVLFGDGAGAAVIGPTDGSGSGILSTHLYADGSQADALQIPAGGSRQPFSQTVLDERLHYVRMSGRDVFKFAVRSLTSAAKTAVSHNGLTSDDVDWVVPHQANTRILDAVQQRSGIAKDRFIVNIHETANTSSASVPIALDQAVRIGKIERGQNLVFCALGGGFAWGSALVRY